MSTSQVRDFDAEAKKSKLSQQQHQTEDVGNEDEKEVLNTKKTSSSVFPRKSVVKKKALLTFELDEADEDDRSDPEDGKKLPTSVALLLAASLHISAPLNTDSTRNEFIPNLRPFFHTLNAMQTLICENEYFGRLEPTYTSLWTSIYYGILMCFQVCRSRVACNYATKSESQFARRFEKEFSLDTLVVAGPLAGFFECLGCVRPSSSFDWVCPALPDWSGSSKNKLKFPALGGALFPFIPIMARILYELRYKPDSIIVESVHNSIYFKGARKVYNLDTGDDAGNGYLNLSPGWYPVASSIDDDEDLDSLKKKMKKVSVPPANDDLTPKTVADYCCLTAEESWSWFRVAIRIATHEATFFEGATNMSAVSPFGTPAGIVEVVQHFEYEDKKYEDDSSPFAFFKAKKSSSEAKIDIYSRYGSPEDFRMGAVCQYVSYSFTGTHATSASSLPADTASEAVGPWFSTKPNVLKTTNYHVATTSPYTYVSQGVTNPVGKTNIIVQSQMYKVEGQKK